MASLLGIDDDYDPTDANFGARYELPRFNPPGTYTGALPTPPGDYGSTSAEIPHDYYAAQQRMGNDNPQLNALLKLLYLQRKNRT